MLLLLMASLAVMLRSPRSPVSRATVLVPVYASAMTRYGTFSLSGRNTKYPPARISDITIADHAAIQALRSLRRAMSAMVFSKLAALATAAWTRGVSDLFPDIRSFLVEWSIQPRCRSGRGGI